jgi:hypothetical protein
MKVPVIEITWHRNLPWLESEIETTGAKNKTHKDESETHAKREENFLENTVNIYIKDPREFQRAVNLFRYHVNLYMNSMNQVIASLKCTHLHWKTRCGLWDAAMTFIVSGVFWAMKGMVINRLNKRLISTSHTLISVIPVMDHTLCEVDFQCIFTVRIGKVISVAMGLIKFNHEEATGSG